MCDSLTRHAGHLRTPAVSLISCCRRPFTQVLVLVGTDRLDRPLTIGQMQGKFQPVLLPQVRLAAAWAGDPWTIPLASPNCLPSPHTHPLAVGARHSGGRAGRCRRCHRHFCQAVRVCVIAAPAKKCTAHTCMHHPAAGSGSASRHFASHDRPASAPCCLWPWGLPFCRSSLRSTHEPANAVASDDMYCWKETLNVGRDM